MAHLDFCHACSLCFSTPSLSPSLSDSQFSARPCDMQAEQQSHRGKNGTEL